MPYCNATCLARRGRRPCSGEGCLIRAAQSGEAPASEALFSIVSGLVLRQARMLCRNSDLAQDLAQTALIQVFRSLNQLRDPEKLLPWIRRIVVNAHRMAARSAPPVQFETILPNLHSIRQSSASPADPAGGMDASRALHLVTKAIAALPPLLRETFEYRVLHGLTTKQTAAKLIVTEETVRTRLARARKRLRILLESPAS